MLAGLFAAVLMTSTDTIRLWPGDAPNALGKADKDIPTLTLYKPATANGTAIVVCPGGGYGALADHEGAGYALWFNRLGITAFVLKYRLGSDGYRHPTMLLDASRALRTVRARAKEWGIKPDAIGIIGSSAGGHLASTLLTHFDGGKADSSDEIEGVSSRPDFGILCYAVITMGPLTHSGSKANLLGNNPDPALVKSLSNETMVTPQTPPCFVWHTVEDTVVPVENSIMFAEALRKAKVPYELHLYEKGNHGIGLAGPPDSNNLHPWTHDLAHWLKERGWARELDAR